jgi:DNA (cytosine-5)-methyltransferase 1
MMKLHELHLFAGSGGGILGGHLLGHTTVCAVEIEPYCRKALLQRQRDGALPRFPIWDDVSTFDGTPWRGRVDVVCGGFPCQDISIAGGGAGLSGNRSGLWSEMARIICEVRPKFVFVENSPMLAVRGLDRVLGDLSELGYNARWGCVSAANAGLPHPRDRMWILSYPKGIDLQEPKVVDQERISREFRGATNGGGVCQPGWEMYQPDMARVDDGVGTWVGRSKAIGNGQVPRVAALAWRLLLPSFVNFNQTVQSLTT